MARAKIGTPKVVKLTLPDEIWQWLEESDQPKLPAAVREVLEKEYSKHLKEKLGMLQK